ncbi:AraC family transcriptional regulator [bacterium]|nr:MAG: AraC family transcriptional regulator [bacterium]
MEGMNEHARQRTETNRSELIQRIESLLPKDGQAEPVPGVWFFRTSQATERVYGVMVPAFCVVAQAAKEVYLGGKGHRYDPDHYLLATAELPVTGRISGATPERPYLAMRVDLDPALVGSVMVEAGLVGSQDKSDARAMGVSPLSADLLDAATRLVRLLENPAEARILGPLVKREIVFRLLMGDQGHRLRHLPAPTGHSHRIGEALERLRRDFDKPLRIESLAREMGMSSTRFHHHFKAVTDMSPLQFQKQLRLQEARRLMLGEDLDAGSAGYQVGYEDPSHFNRDYKKLFGYPPAQDAERLRHMVAAG